MSYVVSIRRSEDSPITRDELRATVRDDPTFREATTVSGMILEPSVLDLEWRLGESDRPIGFCLCAGEVTVTTPSNEALRKMQELARALGARIIGEEGEDLTSVQVPEHQPEGFGRGGLVVFLLVAALALYWLLAG